MHLPCLIRVHRWPKKTRLGFACLRLPIKPNRLDSAPELLQRIDSFLSTAAGIADQIVETLLPANDHEMCRPIRIPQPCDDRIFVEQVSINQEVRGQVLVVGQ